jgi:hypothetical protein
MEETVTVIEEKTETITSLTVTEEDQPEEKHEAEEARVAEEARAAEEHAEQTAANARADADLLDRVRANTERKDQERRTAYATFEQENRQKTEARLAEEARVAEVARAAEEARVAEDQPEEKHEEEAPPVVVAAEEPVKEPNLVEQFAELGGDMKKREHFLETAPLSVHQLNAIRENGGLLISEQDIITRKLGELYAAEDPLNDHEEEDQPEEKHEEEVPPVVSAVPPLIPPRVEAGEDAERLEQERLLHEAQERDAAARIPHPDVAEIVKVFHRYDSNDTKNRLNLFIYGQLTAHELYLLQNTYGIPNCYLPLLEFLEVLKNREIVPTQYTCSFMRLLIDEDCQDQMKYARTAPLKKEDVEQMLMVPRLDQEVIVILRARLNNAEGYTPLLSLIPREEEKSDSRCNVY